MSLFETIKSWFRALEAAVDAVEEDPYRYLNREMAVLKARVSILENEGSMDLDHLLSRTRRG